MKNFWVILFFFRASAVAQKSRIVKNIFNTAKNFREISRFMASASCSEILNDEIYFNTVKNSRATLFFSASASCSKILNNKKYIFSTVNSGHPLFFRASASCTTECKRYIQYSENFLGNSVFFQDKRSCSKILNVKSIFTTVKIFRATLFFFQGKRKSLKNRELWQNFSTVCIHLGAIRVIWTSVVCNKDQRRVWFWWLWSGSRPRFL